MLQRETLVEGAPKKYGVKYVAANGAKTDNYGEKRVRFKKQGSERHQQHGFPGHRCGQTCSLCVTNP